MRGADGFDLARAGLDRGMRVLVVAAHPDDETVGAGILLRRLTRSGVRLGLAHVTDGAPRDLRDARAAGFDGWEDYARARRQELEVAIAAGGIRTVRCECFGIPDQEGAYALVEVARRLAALIAVERPDAVLTHPYEGGHPDHDASAFAAAAACRIVANGPLRPPDVFEFSSYHVLEGRMRTTAFLPADRNEPVRLRLSSDERAVKACMLASFATQQRVLRQFRVDEELIRRAPRYDFTQPPHGGRLFYEHFDWGVDGRSWRALAREALRTLSIA